MVTWENIGPINCGDSNITLSMCPTVMFLPTTAWRANETEMRTAGMQTLVYAPNFTFIFNYFTHSLTKQPEKSIYLSTYLSK